MFIVALFALTSTPSQASPIKFFSERDVDGVAGTDLAVATYSTLTDLVNNTKFVGKFTRVNLVDVGSQARRGTVKLTLGQLHKHHGYITCAMKRR